MDELDDELPYIGGGAGRFGFRVYRANINRVQDVLRRLGIEPREADGLRATLLRNLHQLEEHVDALEQKVGILSKQLEVVKAEPDSTDAEEVVEQDEFEDDIDDVSPNIFKAAIFFVLNDKDLKLPSVIEARLFLRHVMRWLHEEGVTANRVYVTTNSFPRMMLWLEEYMSSDPRIEFSGAKCKLRTARLKLKP